MNLSLKQKDPDANNKEIDYSEIEPEEEERLFHTSICKFLLWPAPSSILTMLGVKYLSSKLHSFHSPKKQAVLFKFSDDKPLYLCTVKSSQEIVVYYIWGINVFLSNQSSSYNIKNSLLICFDS